jgi:glycosyltransferase involved in cell wall biosynthesis
MTNADYAYDLVIWDTVGGAYTSESMARASGGSEKEIVQLAEGLAAKGLRVLCLNATSTNWTTHHFEGDVEGRVRWDNFEMAKMGVRCKTLIIQRYSTIPDVSRVVPDRMVVRATDVYGNYYDHLSALTHLCVSNWQAEAFRDAAFPCVVVPAMLDDDYYELARTPKVRGRFIYASAWMKGLDETIKKWQLLRLEFAEEMRDCELHITSPGYGKERYVFARENFKYDKSIKFLDDLPPRELAKYMATCEGLFYVNTWNETFCAVAAIAGAVGCKVHVLAKNGLAGMQEAVRGAFSEDEGHFDDCFIRALGKDIGAPLLPQPDFRVSTVLPQWLAALKLERPAEISGHTAPQIQASEEIREEIRKGADLAVSQLKQVSERMRASLTDKERAVLDKGLAKTRVVARSPSLSEPWSPEDKQRWPIGPTMGPGGHFEELADGRVRYVEDSHPMGSVMGTYFVTPEHIPKRVGFSAEAAIAASAKQLVDQSFISPGEKKNVGSYAILGRPEIYDIQDIIAKKATVVTKTPTVCLVMLAKNAESTIKRALDSVRGFVTQVVFQFDDEASSMKTREIIVEVLPTYICPSVMCTYEKWENFSVNRNKLLNTARGGHGCDYVLTLDADDEFVDLSGFDKSQLIADCYSVLIRDGSTEYERPMLWKADKGYHYRGPAHEYLTSETPGLIAATLPGVSYVRHGQNLPPNLHREKYLRDVRLFVAELRKNPEDSRSTYYLGQSLEDASCGTDEELLKQALRVFEARAKMSHGFPDEQFLAAMKSGRIRRRFVLPGVDAAFSYAMAVVPARSPEAAFELANYYNNEGKNYKKALEAIRAVLPRWNRNNLPKGFLVEPSVYLWKLDFEWGLAEFYTGNKEGAAARFKRVLEQAPPEQHETLRKNLEFCKPTPVVQSTILDELEQKYGTNGEKKEISPTRPMTEISSRPSTPVPWFTPKS